LAGPEKESLPLTDGDVHDRRMRLKAKTTTMQEDEDCDKDERENVPE
jgi:hypothetical protein